MQRRLLLVVLAALAVVFVCLLVLWPRPDRITREKFARIHRGMSRTEVEAILDGPPGDYSTEPVEEIFAGNIWLGDRWLGDEGVIDIVFVDGEGAVRLQFNPVLSITRNTLERWLWRIQHQWQKRLPDRSGTTK
jgi:hypothetical protein